MSEKIKLSKISQFSTANLLFFWKRYKNVVALLLVRINALLKTLLFAKMSIYSKLFEKWTNDYFHCFKQNLWVFISQAFFLVIHKDQVLHLLIVVWYYNIIVWLTLHMPSFIKEIRSEGCTSLKISWKFCETEL